MREPGPLLMMMEMATITSDERARIASVSLARNSF
jgi:hypothetical protein